MEHVLSVIPPSMILISNGNSEMNAHMWSNLIILGDLLKARAVANLNFILEKTCFPSQVRFTCSASVHISYGRASIGNMKIKVRHYHALNSAFLHMELPLILYAVALHRSNHLF